MAPKKGLNKARGLNALIDIGDKEMGNQTPAKDSVVMMKINKVEPNRDQPRKNFEEDALQELSESIKQHGIIQPLLVQKKDDYYEIIAGERRFRASKIAGLTKIPAIVKNYSERQIKEISLIELISGLYGSVVNIEGILGQSLEVSKIIAAKPVATVSSGGGAVSKEETFPSNLDSILRGE